MPCTSDVPVPAGKPMELLDGGKFYAQQEDFDCLKPYIICELKVKIYLNLSFIIKFSCRKS